MNVKYCKNALTAYRYTSSGKIRGRIKKANISGIHEKLFIDVIPQMWNVKCVLYILITIYIDSKCQIQKFSAYQQVSAQSNHQSQSLKNVPHQFQHFVNVNDIDEQVLDDFGNVIVNINNNNMRAQTTVNDKFIYIYIYRYLYICISYQPQSTQYR